MSDHIHATAPVCPWMDRQLQRVPGMVPAEEGAFPLRDACFAGQMRLKDALIARKPESVIATLPESRAAVAELDAVVMAHLSNDPAYALHATQIMRPDGVAISRDLPPLARLGRLVQEDLLLLQPSSGQWVLTAGVLCFPSHWTLSQKMGRGLDAIHGPVPFYSEHIGPRVQRLFDLLRPGRPLRRANWLIYPNAELHHPKLEYQQKTVDWGDDLYLRVEHQSLIALPQTGAVLFAIRTELTPLATLNTGQLVSLRAALAGLPPVEYEYKGGDVLRDRLAALASTS